MGAMFGTVTGQTKEATWKAYRDQVGRLANKKEQEKEGMYVQFPTNREDAFKRMKRLPEGGWSLGYRLRT
jgi:hypothetical protein